MQINKLTIENYKCFFERQEVSLQPGFNLFIGKNNSGKTTLLDALNINPELKNLHRSELSVPNYQDQPIGESIFEISIETSPEELRRLFGNEICFPIATDKSLSLEKIPELIYAENKIEISLKFGSETKRLKTKTISGETEWISQDDAHNGLQLKYNGNNTRPETNLANFSGAARTILFNIHRLQKSIYKFSPVRTPKPTSPTIHSQTLLPNAENLPQCINNFQSSDPASHEKLCKLVNQIFPDIKWIQSPLNSNSEFELQCLPTDKLTLRGDLAIRLDNMGTGIGNIIAILYIVLTSRFPQIIAIDEPNSFLHPKALRELLQILESHGKQHQYILTGHSPEVLTAIEPSTITYFEIENSSSKVKQFTKGQFHELRSSLSDLGIRMTDLHAKDRVLWVEGQTEEIVFPKLLREYCPEISAGTAVLRVTHTGTFESNKVHINEVAKTYSKLTQTSLAPPMVAIVLDSEGRQPQDIKKIENENNKLLHFLPYRMIENYALDADAIHAVLKSHGIDTEPSKIEPYLPADTKGKEKADGAKILKEIFTELSSTTCEFRKTTHTPELFDWLLENKKDSLLPLESFVKLVCT